MIDTIEQHRRERGNREAPVDVEHAARERHERDEQDVRKHDADHVRGELDLARRLGEAAGQQVDEPRRGEHAERPSRRAAPAPAACRPCRRASRVASAPLRAVVLGQDRHERLRERAFGEQPAQDVGQPERRLERVHLQPGAERGGLEAFADEAGDAGQERHPADGGQGSEEVQWGGGRRAGMARQRALPLRPCRRHEKSGYYAGLSAVPANVVRSAAKPSERRRTRTRNAQTPGTHSMANSAQARKRARQAEATRKRNASLKSELRTAVKKVKKAIARRRQGRRDEDAAGIAGGDRPHRRQEDRAQEHRRRAPSRAWRRPSRRWPDAARLPRQTKGALPGAFFFASPGRRRVRPARAARRAAARARRRPARAAPPSRRRLPTCCRSLSRAKPAMNAYRRGSSAASAPPTTTARTPATVTGRTNGE